MKKTRTIQIITAAILTLSLTAAVPAFADDLDDAQDELDAATAAYDEANSKYEELQSQINDLQSQIDTIQENLPAQQQAANTAYASMYKNDTLQDMLVSIITADSIDSVLKTFEYYSYLTQANQQAITTAKQSQASLNDSKAVLEATAAQQKEELDKAEAAKNDAQTAYNKAKKAAAAASSESLSSGAGETNVSTGGWMTLAEFKRAGVVYAYGWRMTWYSEKVLPGGALSIPGRHHENGCVCDGDGYICVACVSVPQGTVVPTPLGPGKVYDTGCAAGTIDVYIVS